MLEQMIPPEGGTPTLRTLRSGHCSPFARLSVLLAAPLLFAARVMAQAPAPPADDDIRGPKPKVEIPVPQGFNWTPVIAVACVLAVAAGIYLWWRFGRSKRVEIAAGERALRALYEVDRERNGLLPGPLADRSAGVVRQFVAERFGIAAPQRTTEEFLRDAENAPPLQPHRALLHQFLQSCDAAKFAGVEFDTAERLALLQNAIQFVRAAAAWQPPPSPPPLPPNT